MQVSIQETPNNLVVWPNHPRKTTARHVAPYDFVDMGLKENSWLVELLPNIFKKATNWMISEAIIFFEDKGETKIKLTLHAHINNNPTNIDIILLPNCSLKVKNISRNIPVKNLLCLNYQLVSTNEFKTNTLNHKTLNIKTVIGFTQQDKNNPRYPKYIWRGDQRTIEDKHTTSIGNYNQFFSTSDNNERVEKISFNTNGKSLQQSKPRSTNFFYSKKNSPLSDEDTESYSSNIKHKGNNTNYSAPRIDFSVIKQDPNESKNLEEDDKKSFSEEESIDEDLQKALQISMEEELELPKEISVESTKNNSNNDDSVEQDTLNLFMFFLKSKNYALGNNFELEIKKKLSSFAKIVKERIAFYNSNFNANGMKWMFNYIVEGFRNNENLNYENDVFLISSLKILSLGKEKDYNKRLMYLYGKDVTLKTIGIHMLEYLKISSLCYNKSIEKLTNTLTKEAYRRLFAKKKRDELGLKNKNQVIEKYMPVLESVVREYCVNPDLIRKTGFRLVLQKIRNSFYKKINKEDEDFLVDILKVFENGEKGIHEEILVSFEQNYGGSTAVTMQSLGKHMQEFLKNFL